VFEEALAPRGGGARVVAAKKNPNFNQNDIVSNRRLISTNYNYICILVHAALKMAT